jgi:hypothetical protein
MEIISNKNLDITDLTKPLLIAYDNEIKEETNRLIKTLENNKWDYMIVGKGEKWYGLISKIIKYNEILKNLPQNKIVILSDARDVYCCRGPKTFIEAFNTFDDKIVISAELFLEGRINWSDENIKENKFIQSIPITDYWNYHNVKNLPNRKYVNSGLIAGKAIDLIEITNWVINYCITNNTSEDQIAYAVYANKFPEKIILDSDAIILHTSTFGVNAGIQDIHIQKLDSPTFSEFFGNSAFFLHIPGTCNKGQRAIYDYSWKFIELGISNETLLNLYGYNEISWHDKY